MSSGRFTAGDEVVIQSKVSKYRGFRGTVDGYCNGKYPDICRVRLGDRKTVNIFDKNVEKVGEKHER